MRATPQNHRERGEGRAKFIITLALIITVIYLCFKFVPPYVNNYQLQDTLDTESRFYAARQKKEDKVRDSVWAEVQSLGIPVEKDAIRVEMVGRTARVSVDYVVPVELPGYTVNLEFHTKGESPVV
jgi:hypothetical protein